MAYQITTPPAFLEPFGEKISDATVQQIGQPIDISKISPQVAQLSPLIPPTACVKSSKYVLPAASINGAGNICVCCSSAIKQFLHFQVV